MAPVRVWLQHNTICVQLPSYEYQSLGNVLKDITGDFPYNRTFVLTPDQLPLARPLIIKHASCVVDSANVLQLPPFVDPHADDLFTYIDHDLQPYAAVLGTASTYGSVCDTLLAFYAQEPAISTAIGYAKDSGILIKSEPKPYMTLEHNATSFFAALVSAFTKAWKAETNADGSVREYLTKEGFSPWWEKVRFDAYGTSPATSNEKYYPMRASMPAYLAALIAKTAGPPFTRTDNGIERTYRPWLIRVGNQHVRTEIDGATMHIASWASLAIPGDTGGVIMHMSSVGAYQVNKALWAAFMGGSREWIELVTPRATYSSDKLLARREQGKNNYTVLWNTSPLPTSRLTHMSITHKSDDAPRPGYGFLHLVGDHVSGYPDMDRFFAQLDKAVTIPVLPTWKEQLWGYGSEFGLITKLKSHNCTAYWVNVSEQKWTRIVQALMTGQDPHTVNAEIEIHGVDVIDESDIVLEHDHDLDTEEEE